MLLVWARSCSFGIYSEVCASPPVPPFYAFRIVVHSMCLLPWLCTCVYTCSLLSLCVHLFTHTFEYMCVCACAFLFLCAFSLFVFISVMGGSICGTQGDKLLFFEKVEVHPLEISMVIGQGVLFLPVIREPVTIQLHAFHMSNVNEDAVSAVNRYELYLEGD